MTWLSIEVFPVDAIPDNLLTLQMLYVSLLRRENMPIKLQKEKQSLGEEGAGLSVTACTNSGINVKVLRDDFEHVTLKFL